MFKIAADIKTADQLRLPRPEAVYHTEVSQPTAIQKEMVQMLSERAAKVHSGTVDPSNDNMLKITSDGRKLGLDQRIINPDLPDDPSSKVNRCVDNIFRIWQDGQADKLTQLVFCDLSTPKIAAAKRAEKPAGGALDNPELHALETQLASDGITSDAPFSVYDDIRSKLVALGIPREQIAYIHEANTEVRKKELFAKVRSGQVRVLMGSTFKMGAGMNVQDRLVALHDLDCPWRPGDLEQRGGRIIRQGNRNKEVHIYRYVTEGTFDAYLWQTIENKQRFISQIMTSKSPVRSCEDIDETALSYAEIKALCAGDERIKEKMDLDVDVARLRLMRANHQSQQYKLEDNLLRYFPEQIEAVKNAIAGLETDMQTVAAHPHPTDGFAGMEVKGDLLTDKDMIGIPWMLAFALRDYGWYLRSDIIWQKVNPMPESCKDRPSRCYEHVFLLTKSRSYYYDALAIAEPMAPSSIARYKRGRISGKYAEEIPGQNKVQGLNQTRSGGYYEDGAVPTVRNKRDVWQINPFPYKGGHFAAFPPKLVETCLLAGCPQDGIVLDPFLGSGTTAAVAKQMGRHYIGIELNPDYCALAEQRIGGVTE